MSESSKPESSNTKVLLVTWGLAATGIILILLSVLGGEAWHWPEWTTHYVRDLGLLLAAVMAGTIIHEKLLRDEMIRSFDRTLDEKINPVPTETAQAIHQLLLTRPPGLTGIRKLSDERRSYHGYYKWVRDSGSHELFFAGRSVLNRIATDIRAQGETTIEDAVLRRLKEGCQINILFLDARVDMIERLAREEAQSKHSMLGDIGEALQACRAMALRIGAEWQECPRAAKLTIGVYDRVPYFAYHKQDSEAIVGFYFDSAMGMTSAAYELIDDETKRAFQDHFVSLRKDAVRENRVIVDFDGAKRKPPTYDDKLLDVLMDACK